MHNVGGEFLRMGIRGSSYKKFQKILHLGDPPWPGACYRSSVDNAAGLRSPALTQGGCVYETRRFGSRGIGSYGSDGGTDCRLCSGEGHPAKAKTNLRRESGREAILCGSGTSTILWEGHRRP